MKTGICIINAARGGVIDEVALIKAIEKNKVKFAGLDAVSYTHLTLPTILLV